MKSRNPGGKPGGPDVKAGTRRRLDITPYLFIAPQLILFTIFFIVPAATGIIAAFSKWNIYTDSMPTFNFLDNFKQILFDSQTSYYQMFRTGMFNTLLFVVICVPFCILLPLFMAILDGHHVSQIYVVEMEDYTHVKEGAGHILCITPEQQWELLNNADYQWNEGPDMLKHNGTYYLFYSGGYYGDKSYSLGYATSDSPTGPFVKYEGNPIMSSTEAVSGPGNNSFFYSLDGKELFNCYHSHTVAALAGGNRKVNIDRCGWREDGTFYMNGPTTSAQPAPSGESALVPVTGDFTVTASSTAKGRPEAILDGEFSATTSGYKQEWCAADGEKAKITIDFGGERAVDCLFLYRGYEDTATLAALKITFSDGSVISNVSLPGDSAEAAILYFDTVMTSSLTIEVTDMGSAKRFALAEVGIYSINDAQ